MFILGCSSESTSMSPWMLGVALTCLFVSFCFVLFCLYGDLPFLLLAEIPARAWNTRKLEQIIMCMLKGLVNKGDNKMCGQLIARWLTWWFYCCCICVKFLSSLPMLAKKYSVILFHITRPVSFYSLYMHKLFDDNDSWMEIKTQAEIIYSYT